MGSAVAVSLPGMGRSHATNANKINAAIAGNHQRD
jgi:hypothetical protein